MAKEELHVIVIGAGLAGLSIAHGLRRNNIPYTIFDRETTPRDRSWGITLSWALPMLYQLLPDEIFQNLQACQTDPTLDPETAGKKGILIRDGHTGAIRERIPFPVIRRVNIQKTKKNLAHGLNIKYGKKLVDIIINENTRSVEAVTAKFDDGTEISGSVIVGADGGNSVVRKWLLGPLAAQEVLPFAFMNFSFTLPRDKALWLDSEMNPTVDVATHPKSMYMGLFCLDKPDLQRPETWIFYVLTTWPIASKDDEENSENRMERLRRHMEGWGDPYKAVIDALPDDLEIIPDQLRIWHPKPWNNHHGRVTLAGDAAHSMTFHRGQGGNLAIKGAFEFVNCMVAVQHGQKSLQQAVTDYDAGLIERGEEVAISKAQAFAYHDYENFDSSPVMLMGIKALGKKPDA